MQLVKTTSRLIGRGVRSGRDLNANLDSPPLPANDTLLLPPPILVLIESCRPISLITMSALSNFSDFDIELGAEVERVVYCSSYHQCCH
ncbi:hypothetical protein Nepgr_019323 [Nepenthes gracilis]|uniref:Uncharacterized protein n=1 Tax=Nepenthes gracilis TaxID=150966 RepID=A0AAD3SUQ4_NEPGR|nr:hypothetical protein Nepgr_019323 [Nepenthes gracilis]